MYLQQYWCFKICQYDEVRDDVMSFEEFRWTYAMIHILSTSNKERDELFYLFDDICYAKDTLLPFSLKLESNGQNGVICDRIAELQIF